jgi:hypothetical protein
VWKALILEKEIIYVCFSFSLTATASQAKASVSMFIGFPFNIINYSINSMLLFSSLSLSPPFTGKKEFFTLSFNFFVVLSLKLLEHVNENTECTEERGGGRME